MLHRSSRRSYTDLMLLTDMMRQGAEGTAVAVTEQQLEQYVARLAKKRQN